MNFNNINNKYNNYLIQKLCKKPTKLEWLLMTWINNFWLGLGKG